MEDVQSHHFVLYTPKSQIDLCPSISLNIAAICVWFVVGFFLHDCMRQLCISIGVDDDRLGEVGAEIEIMKMGMYGKNVESRSLIPRKLCFWREIFAILRGNISFRWIFLSFSYKQILTYFFYHIPGKFCIFSSLENGIYCTVCNWKIKSEDSYSTSQLLLIIPKAPKIAFRWINFSWVGLI